MSSKKLINILLHIICTILIIIIPVFMMPLKDPDGQPDFLNIQRILFTVLQVGGFYFNAYVLYPRFLLRKRVTAYILSVVGASLLLAVLPLSLHRGQELALTGIIAQGSVKFMIGLFVMGTGTCYRFIIDVIRQQNVIQEHQAIELSFLRSQVSPHFMFNSLNSMVALARKKSDILEPALLKMSSLMHYMLYDSDEEKVSVSRELEYLQSYVDLQTLRFGDSVKILFHVQQSNGYPLIEPMLLIPLIENAFKHGTTTTDQPEITISFSSTEQELVLSVANRVSPGCHSSTDQNKGIGLNNLKRRLAILYPGKHDFTVKRKDEWFYANLRIRYNND